MPHTWNNILVVTKNELVPDWYTVSALDKNLARHRNLSFGLKRVRNGGFGHELLISFDSLPSHIQEGLGDPRKGNHILEKYYKIDGAAVDFYTKHKFADGTYLDFEQQERYIINASVLTAVIQLRAERVADVSDKRGKLKKLMNSLTADTASFNKVLKSKYQVSHSIPETEKHFKRVLNAFETLGYISIIPATHKNQNRRKVTEDTVSLLKSMFTEYRRKPTATDVFKKYNLFIAGKLDVINNETGELYQPEAFKTLSDATVKKYMADWANRIGTHAKRSGNRQVLIGQYRPHHSFKRPEYAGSILSIDDRQPPFKAKNGKRIWFYNAFDIGSYAFTCWVYGTSKEGIILEFYRQLVRNYAAWGFNLPAELEAEMSLNSSFINTFLRPGAMFEHVHIEANNARAKYIERVYGSLRNEYEKDMDGFIARPFAKKESNQPGPAEVPTLPYNDIVELCLRQLQDWNNRPHPEHPELSRWEFFCQKQQPNLKPTNYLSFLPHIGKKTKTSCRAGIIKLDNREFLLGDNGKVSLGEKLITLMKRVEGEQIDIYWLDDDTGKIFKALIYINDQYICEAVAKPMYHRATIERTAACHEAQAIMSAYVATIDGFAKRQRNSIDGITMIERPGDKKKTFTIPSLKTYTVDENRVAAILPDLPEEPEYIEKIDSVLDQLSTASRYFGTLKDRF